MSAIRREEAASRGAVSDKIIAEFRSFFRELRCMGGDRMRRGGVTTGNFHLLSMLDRHGEMAMSRMAELLDVSLSNASGIIDRLEERGLVERVRVSDDRRIVLVRVTELGNATLAQVEVLKEEMLKRVLNRLDGKQLERVAGALKDIAQAATAELADDPDWLSHSQSHHGYGLTHQPHEPAARGATLEGVN